MTTGKTITLTIQTSVGTVMCLLLNMLSRLVAESLPRGKHLLISWLQSPSAVILEPKTIKSVTASTFSHSIYHEMIGPDAVILVFWMLSFKSGFSLSSFTLLKRLFSSSSLSAIKVVSSAYLSLLIFLPAILIPGCDPSNPAFHLHEPCCGKGACLTQWSYEPCHTGPPKDRSLEEGMANHSSILASRTPWTVWKGKKIWHQKMSIPPCPGQMTSNMLLEKSRDIAPERKKRLTHSRNDVQLWCDWWWKWSLML